MKKIISFAGVAVMMISLLCACGSNDASANESTGGSVVKESEIAETESTVTEEISDSTENDDEETESKWQIQQTVDEFGDVTEDSETVVSTPITGDFSNTATSSSELTGVVFLTVGGDGDTTFFTQNGQLYSSTVVGDHPYFTFRLMEYGNTQATYTSYDEITLKTKIDDTIYEFNEVMSTPPNGDLTVCDTWETTYNALYSGVDVRCIINIGSSQYNFTIYADNFSELVKEAGLITDTVYYNETDDEELYNEAIALMDAGQYSDAVEIFERIEDYEDSSDLILECVCLAHYTQENWTLWKTYFNLSEHTALTDEAISSEIIGDWYGKENNYSTYSADGSYTYHDEKIGDSFGTWVVEEGRLIINRSASSSEFTAIYHFYKNAYVFAYQAKSGTSYDLYIKNGTIEP